MAEREIARTRETEASQVIRFEHLTELYAAWRNRANTGVVVVKAGDRPWEMARQGKLKYFLHPTLCDTAVEGWLLFLHDIRMHSGRHRHQGALAIYIVEGKGWTVVDDVRCDWDEGDLLLLPVKPQGVDHQHFNAVPGAHCKWLAFIYVPFMQALGHEREQKENSPDWTGA